MTKGTQRAFMSINRNARGLVTNGDALPSFPSKKALDAHLRGVCGELTASICQLHLVCLSFSATGTVFSGWPPPVIERDAGPGPGYFHPTWDSSKCTPPSSLVGRQRLSQGCMDGWWLPWSNQSSLSPCPLTGVNCSEPLAPVLLSESAFWTIRPVTGFVWDSSWEASTNIGSTGLSQGTHLSFICIQLCFLRNVLGRRTISLNFSSLIFMPSEWSL